MEVTPGRALTMKIRDEELLARLLALGSKARRAGSGSSVAGDEVARLLGLPEHELTPVTQAALHHLVEEVVGLRQTLEVTEARLAELERLADEDALAPVLNRRAFLRHLGRTISYIARYGAESSLLYFDLNGLKRINDDFGHAAGDKALLHVAETLLGNTRNSDLVGRLGGDEFGVVLARAGYGVAEAKALRLAAAVADRAVVHEGRTIAVEVACGVHELSPDEDPQRALAAADQAMYERKRATGLPRIDDRTGPADPAPPRLTR